MTINQDGFANPLSRPRGFVVHGFFCERSRTKKANLRGVTASIIGRFEVGFQDTAVVPKKSYRSWKSSL